MATDLLSIAQSGVRAARVALDLTAQNVANAGTQGYVRRSVSLSEVASVGGIGVVAGGELSLSGVRFDGVVRNVDAFRQGEVRRTGSDLARAEAEVTGLQGVEDAVAQSGVFEALVAFDGSLQQLLADPTDGGLREAALAAARTAADGFNIASHSLDAAGDGARVGVGFGVGQVNSLAAQLAKVNVELVRNAPYVSDRTALLDQRDLLLGKLSEYADLGTAFAPDGSVEVRLGGSAGALLVSGASAAPLSYATAADGTVSFTAGSTPVTLSGGALAGHGQVLVKLADVRTRLDAAAGSLIAAANTAQANGVALDGTGGQPLFGGSDAATIAVALGSGSGLATAPTGAAPGSRDPANLAALRGALERANAEGQADALLSNISSAVAGRTVTRDALRTVAASASAALEAQAGVDLDQEAVNLLRYQRAFQASGRAIQVASDIFDTLVGIG